jgi:transcriptional regulator with XRE-family HTH domain
MAGPLRGPAIVLSGAEFRCFGRCRRGVERETGQRATPPGIRATTYRSAHASRSRVVGRRTDGPAARKLSTDHAPPWRSSAKVDSMVNVDDLTPSAICPPDVADRLGDHLRRMRRTTGLSRREFAARSGVPRGTIGRIESDGGGACDPRLSTLSRLVRVAGYRLLICGPDNDAVEPWSQAATVFRDLAGRRLPSHLDPQPARDERYRLWWDRAGVRSATGVPIGVSSEPRARSCPRPPGRPSIRARATSARPAHDRRRRR